jgi:hypothetical protein
MQPKEASQRVSLTLYPSVLIALQDSNSEQPKTRVMITQSRRR